MESKVQKAKNNADIAEENDGVTAEKIKFPLYVFPERMTVCNLLLCQKPLQEKAELAMLSERR